MDYEEVAFEMRYLQKKDLPRVMALQELVAKRLDSEDLFATLSYELMELHIGAKGFMIGTFVKGELIAFRNVYFPGVEKHEWHLGYDIDLESPADLRRVANLQLICVHPDYRGNSLGRRMNLNAIRRIRADQYVHLCATVSPFNNWNIKVLLDCGFSIRKLKFKYGGKLRYIVYQNLTRPVVFPDPQDQISVRLTDIGRQEELIKQGFIGVQLQKIPEFCSQTQADYADGFKLFFSKAIRL
jgi:ribosomal protein S18 acetylase RimI-like enzyme